MSKFLDPDFENLGSTLSNMFEIPVYQRPYKWEKEQLQDLFEDFMDEYKNEGCVFLGSVFLSLKNTIGSNLNVYEVIDGQQRITTIALILLVIYSTLFNDESIIAEQDIDVNSIKSYLWKQKGLSNVRDHRLVTAGKLEQNHLDHLFNWCLDCPKDFLQKVKQEKKNNSSIFSESFYENIGVIYEYINSYVLTCEVGDMKGASTANKLKLFYNYLIKNVYVITITLNNSVNQNRKKLFEIFESINSKGRKLDEIDLIKSYIFQNIDIDDYDEYLEKWGELINKTSDNLSDYLGVFINAKIKYYKNSINVKTFRSFSTDTEKGLMKYYDSNDLSETLKRFVDDMVRCVDCYGKLIGDNDALINDSEFKFYSEVLRKLNYSHPKALLFRVYCDYVNDSIEKIKKHEVISITKATITFMLLFQTLQEKDSRETAGKFEEFMKLIYNNKLDYYKSLMAKIRSELLLSNLTDVNIHNKLANHIGYEANAKNETKILLAAYECFDGKKFAYDKMTAIIKESDIHVDHIAVRHPDENNENYSYYRKKTKDGDVLFLKKNSDFLNKPNIQEGMEYNLFIQNTLNRTGNLQLMWGSENKEKSNGIIILPKYLNFSTYHEIIERANKIADTLCSQNFFSID